MPPPVKTANARTKSILLTEDLTLRVFTIWFQWAWQESKVRNKHEAIEENWTINSRNSASHYVVMQCRMVQDPTQYSLNKVPLHRTRQQPKYEMYFRDCQIAQAKPAMLFHHTLRSWDNVTDQVVPLERNLYGHPSAGWLSERKLAEVLLEEGWEVGEYQEKSSVGRRMGGGRIPGEECL